MINRFMILEIFHPKMHRLNEISHWQFRWQYFHAYHFSPNPIVGDSRLIFVFKQVNGKINSEEMNARMINWYHLVKAGTWVFAWHVFRFDCSERYALRSLIFLDMFKATQEAYHENLKSSEPYQKQNLLSIHF